MVAERFKVQIFDNASIWLTTPKWHLIDVRTREHCLKWWIHPWGACSEPICIQCSKSRRIKVGNHASSWTMRVCKDVLVFEIILASVHFARSLTLSYGVRFVDGNITRMLEEWYRRVAWLLTIILYKPCTSGFQSCRWRMRNCCLRKMG